MTSLPHADPGTPDVTSPTAYLRWVGARQWRTLVIATAFGIIRWRMRESKKDAGRSSGDGRPAKARSGR